MPRRVLVALDHSEASEQAARFVNDFFGDLDVELLGISVARVPRHWIPPSTGYGVVYPWGPADTLSQEAVTAGLAAADEEAERAIDDSDLDADERLVERGDPAEAIIDAAKEHDVDLIVVGTNDKGIFERLVEGSVSREVTREAPLPVLLVR